MLELLVNGTWQSLEVLSLNDARNLFKNVNTIDLNDDKYNYYVQYFEDKKLLSVYRQKKKFRKHNGRNSPNWHPTYGHEKYQKGINGPDGYPG